MPCFGSYWHFPEGGFLKSWMLMSDQRWRSCCTLSDGKHNNNDTSNKKPRSKNLTRNATIDANILLIGHRYASLFYCRKHIDVLPWFSHVGNAYEWSTLKVMLHIVGWQAQQQQYEYYKARSKNSTRNPNIHTWPRYVRASPVRRSDFL